MKKLFIAALFAITFITSAFAADTKVNSVILSSFKFEFKNASNVQWTTGKDFVKATFIYDNKNMEAYYSPNGDMIGTSKPITLDQLTVRAKRNFAKKFDGYNVTEAIRFEGAEEGAFYISAKNEKETVVVKVSDDNLLSIIKRTKN